MNVATRDSDHRSRRNLEADRLAEADDPFGRLDFYVDIDIHRISVVGDPAHDRTGAFSEFQESRLGVDFGRRFGLFDRVGRDGCRRPSPRQPGAHRATSAATYAWGIRSV